MHILIAFLTAGSLVGVHQYVSSVTPTNAAVIRMTEDPNESSEPVPEHTDSAATWQALSQADAGADPNESSEPVLESTFGGTPRLVLSEDPNDSDDPVSEST
jgi:hypothetical protein